MTSFSIPYTHYFSFIHVFHPSSKSLSRMQSSFWAELGGTEFNEFNTLDELLKSSDISIAPCWSCLSLGLMSTFRDFDPLWESLPVHLQVRIYRASPDPGSRLPLRLTKNPSVRVRHRRSNSYCKANNSLRAATAATMECRHIIQPTRQLVDFIHIGFIKFSVECPSLFYHLSVNARK